MIRYKGNVIRPPSEAESLLIQVTYGCSHGKCAFCGTYTGKPFQARPFEDVRKDLDWAKMNIDGDFRRIFLCDGDAMCLSFGRLDETLGLINRLFPDLHRVGIYANARDILAKSETELRALSAKKLTMAYLGLESGSDEVLARINKGATSSDMVAAVKTAQACGIKMSVIGLLGLGGLEGSKAHASATAKAVNAMNPRFLSFLTVMPVPGTPFHDDVEEGRFAMLEPIHILRELRQIVSELELKGTIFRTNHASNYAPLEGRFPQDKERLIAELDMFLKGNISIRPEFLRGL